MMSSAASTNGGCRNTGPICIQWITMSRLLALCLVATLGSTQAAGLGGLGMQVGRCFAPLRAPCPAPLPTLTLTLALISCR